MSEWESSPGRAARLPRFLVGRDSRGRWVARDRHGLCGGLFVSRAEAVRYAMFESGRQAQAVIMVPGVLELEIAPAEMPACPPAVRRAA